MKLEKISKEHLETFIKMVDEAETIAIASHVNPDGDNLGSSLALRRSLEKYGKDIEVIAIDPIDDYLKFLPELDQYKEASRDKYDLFIIVDCSEFDRIGHATEIAKRSDKTIVMDHHVGGKINCDLNMIYDTSPATCEIVYEVIDRLDLPMDETIGTLLFTGLCTDTGRFMYSNVTEYTFRAAGSLISSGVDYEYIYRNLYQSRPVSVMQFHNEVIAKAEFFDKKAFAIASKELVNKHKVQMGDAESIVNKLRDLKEVNVAMIVKEYDDGEYKVSLRSKTADVAAVARANGGGGHIKASGFSIFDESLEAASKKALAILKEIDA
ncbi:bifunctional oligoribonuclease/PAP phosphatase NrnA [uncultured Anaerococcus sp.]|uniref:DHH family phosphoesterase n=1 Tax=uncultured Anaerococcus sp. TaxID=293428 RepID=UPI0026117FCB|nr:bifunctional oligoribonuclease/PAP phosphatase NrnA [uncultured Anaerococcus sp.]